MRAEIGIQVGHQWTRPCSPESAHRLLTGRDHIPTLGALLEAVYTLNAVDAFRPRFAADDWRILGAYLVRQTLGSGDTLIRQGEPGRMAFLVESGTLRGHTYRTGYAAAPIAILRAGAIVGESALFGDMLTLAQVDSISPCVVWTLERLRLEALLAGHPKLAFELLRAAGVVMSKRIQVSL